MFYPKGIITSMATSFRENGELDLSGIIENIKFQKQAGIKTICVLGGTGEATSLTQEERHQIMEATMSNSEGLHVVIGALAGRPSDVKADISKAKELGADACMVVATPFIRPSERDVEAFMIQLASLGQPLVLFNSPSRSGFSMSVSLISKLSKVEGIVGIKESSGDIILMHNVLQECKQPFGIVTGGDNLYFPSVALGADGGLLATAAVLPEVCLALEDAILHADLNKAREYHCILHDLDFVMYKASHPVPLKFAMQFRGLPVGKCRPPFSNLDTKHEEEVYAVMRDISKKLKGKISLVSDYLF